jgi:hypothetical protein
LVVEDDENDALLIRRAFQKAEITNSCHYSPSGEAAMAYPTFVDVADSADFAEGSRCHLTTIPGS